jgi:hypothetical protein
MNGLTAKFVLYQLHVYIPKELTFTNRLAGSVTGFASRLFHAPHVRALTFGQSFGLGLACLGYHQCQLLQSTSSSATW